MGTFNYVNEELLSTDDDVLTVHVSDLAQIKNMALSSARGRARLCAHHNGGDPLHEMLIALVKDNYIRPHKHPGKTESFHMIEGRLMIVIFNDDGKVLQCVHLSAPTCPSPDEQAFYYRLAIPMYHTVIPMTEVAVFHETTNGPFRPEDTFFADWSPSESDDKSVQSAYIQEILQHSLVKSNN
ncbi:MAG: cupin [Rhodospirillaceae bacterium]|nr:MAG: cupin [Rhodospirillaceae bacterium]